MRSLYKKVAFDFPATRVPPRGDGGNEFVTTYNSAKSLDASYAVMAEKSKKIYASGIRHGGEGMRATNVPVGNS